MSLASSRSVLVKVLSLAVKRLNHSSSVSNFRKVDIPRVARKIPVALLTQVVVRIPR